MKLISELPHIIIDCKSPGSWLIPPAELHSFRTAWNTGKSFWAGMNIYGEAIEIKLGDVIGFTVLTEVSLSIRKQERDIMEERELLENSD